MLTVIVSHHLTEVDIMNVNAVIMLIATGFLHHLDFCTMNTNRIEMEIISVSIQKSKDSEGSFIVNQQTWSSQDLRRIDTELSRSLVLIMALRLVCDC